MNRTQPGARRSHWESLDRRLGALLLASFAVQVLRLVTGWGVWSSVGAGGRQLLGLLGLLACLAGNRARCTLADWDLWLLVVLATTAATLDVVSVVVDLDTIERLSLGWRLAPCQRVAMLGAVAAPILEVLCVQASDHGR